MAGGKSLPRIIPMKSLKLTLDTANGIPRLEHCSTGASGPIISIMYSSRTNGYQNIWADTVASWNQQWRLSGGQEGIVGLDGMYIESYVILKFNDNKRKVVLFQSLQGHASRTATG